MALTLDGLGLTYPTFSFGPVSTTFEQGVNVVLGPSGSGKSTLLALIAGFETPARGRIHLDGERIDTKPPEGREVGVVFQNYALFPHLTVRENLDFGAAVGADVQATAEMLEIEPLLERDPETLSGGEKQRVALARALISNPSVLLLDEPLASLDAPIRRRLRLDLRDVLAELAIPVVYVTHDQDEASVVGDRLAIMLDGEIVQEGPTETVFGEPTTSFVADFLGMENIFSGTVVGTNGEETLVDVGPTTLTARGLTKSAAVDVAIHPRTIDLAEPGDGSPVNALECRVDRVITQHTDATIVLSCDGLGRLTATVDGPDAASLEPGQVRIASVDPDDVHLTVPGR